MAGGYPLQSNDGRHSRRLLPLLDRLAGPHRAAAAVAGARRHRRPGLLDHGLTGTNRARPGLDQALAALREGDTLVVPKLDRLARSVPDARDIGDGLAARGIKLSLGGQVYDPTDPMGKMFFNILATFAEFEVDLLRTREGMAVARAKGRLKGRRPKLSTKQQTELRRMHGTGDYTITDLAELFNISRPTVYRPLTAVETVAAQRSRR